MPAKGKKNLPINLSTHKLIKQAAAELDTEMYLLVDAAWTCFCEKYGGKSIAHRGYPQVVETDDAQIITSKVVTAKQRGGISTLPDAAHQELSQIAGRILAEAERLASLCGNKAYDARRVLDRSQREQQALVEEAEKINRRYPEGAADTESPPGDAERPGFRNRRGA